MTVEGDFESVTPALKLGASQPDLCGHLLGSTQVFKPCPLHFLQTSPTKYFLFLCEMSNYFDVSVKHPAFLSLCLFSPLVFFFSHTLRLFFHSSPFSISCPFPSPTVISLLCFCPQFLCSLYPFPPPILLISLLRDVLFLQDLIYSKERQPPSLPTPFMKRTRAVLHTPPPANILPLA